LRPTPIFDTNVLADVQRGRISRSDWQTVIRHRPRRGWPLSSVTALELLAGLEDVPLDRFPPVSEQLDLAFELSKGRILEDPRHLICSEVLHIPLPCEFEPFGRFLTRFLDVARHAKSNAEILRREVRYKTVLTRGKGRSGFDSRVITELVAGPKRKWCEQVEDIVSKNYPQWREHFAKTGKRLPPDMRKAHEPWQAWAAQRGIFGKGFLEWIGAPSDPQSVTGMTDRLSAAIEFTMFVAREFLINNYSVEKHESDVYDQFQLHYLAMDRFIIVSGDPDLSKRTSRSPQAARIMSFQQFLQTL
jgi:hypothetical protein